MKKNDNYFSLYIPIALDTISSYKLLQQLPNIQSFSQITHQTDARGILKQGSIGVAHDYNIFEIPTAYKIKAKSLTQKNKDLPNCNLKSRPHFPSLKMLHLSTCLCSCHFPRKECLSPSIYH